ncbi:hypothetical protein SDC9_203178 [bioreactor metagenome]|uniref:Uncharacterized protein n=1 Tax=bioreactor metagenome TaxID=1076179 RepID=A0A645IVP9_9ZZZZ
MVAGILKELHSRHRDKANGKRAHDAAHTGPQGGGCGPRSHFHEGERNVQNDEAAQEVECCKADDEAEGTFKK